MEYNDLIEFVGWGDPLPENDPLAEKGHITYALHIPERVIRRKAREKEKIYLSNFLTELPHGVFHKGAMGVGGTTLALDSKKNIIICFPTKNLVENKWFERDRTTHEITGHRTDILCVCGGMNDSSERVRKYIQKRQMADKPVKIVCTYDQCEKICRWMIGQTLKKIRGKYMWVQDDSQMAMGFTLDTYDLLIDEIHQAWFIYGDAVRRKRIKGMLKCMQWFDGGKNVTCMTATPIKDLAWFKELEDFPVYKIVGYPPTTPTTIKEIHPQLGNDCAKKIMDYLTGKEGKNANLHIFINSVNFIVSVLKKVDLAKYGNQIKVVCSESDGNINSDKIKNVAEQQFYKQMKDEMKRVEDATKTAFENMDEFNPLFELMRTPISSVTTPPKKINFYTATAWAGCDIFDKNGITLVIADSTKATTMMDISTTYIQIIGRIRDATSPFVYFWYNKENRYVGAVDFDKKIAKTNQQSAKLIREQNELSDLLNMLSDEQRSAFYIDVDDETGQWVKDDNLEKWDKMNYKIVNGQFAASVNISAEMWKAGLKVQDGGTIEDNIGKKLMKRPNQRTTFKMLFEHYVQLQYNPSLFHDVRSWDAKEVLEHREPMLKPALEILGENKVKELGYNRRKIENELKQYQSTTKWHRIIREFGLKVGDSLTKEQRDILCTRIAAKMNLKKIRINDFFETMRSSQRVNGEIVPTVKIMGVKSPKNKDI